MSKDTHQQHSGPVVRFEDPEVASTVLAPNLAGYVEHGRKAGVCGRKVAELDTGIDERRRRITELEQELQRTRQDTEDLMRQRNQEHTLELRHRRTQAGFAQTILALGGQVPEEAVAVPPQGEERAAAVRPYVNGLPPETGVWSRPMPVEADAAAAVRGES